MSGDPVLAHEVRGPDGGPTGDAAEPLLLLNGGLMTWAAWEPLSTGLAKRYRLILCDLRGQLMSPGDPPAELEGNVSDLTALLDHLEIESTHVLGASYGGEIGLLMAALAPERVRSLVGVTVADYADEQMKRVSGEWRQLLAAAVDPESRGAFHRRLIESVYSEGFLAKHGEELAARAAQVAALPDVWWQGVRGIFDAVDCLDVRRHLAAIRCPTLVVIAGADQLMPAGRSLALAAAVAGAETRMHETSGHALVAEDPRWLAQVSLDFLARHAVSESGRAVAPDPTPSH